MTGASGGTDSRLAAAARRVGAARFVVLGVALVLLIPGIAAKPFQADEAYVVMFSRMPLAQLLAAVRNDVTPPLHFLLLHVWGLSLGDGVGSLRLFSAVCTLAAVIVTMLLGASIGGRRCGVVAGGLLGTMPLSVAYGQMVKADALGLLLVVATAYATFRACRQAATWRAWLWVAVLFAADLYGYYLAGFLAFGLLAAVAVWSATRRRDLARLVTALGLSGVLFYPWVPSLRHQVSSTRAIGSGEQLTAAAEPSPTRTAGADRSSGDWLASIKSLVKDQPTLRMGAEVLAGIRPLPLDRRTGSRASAPLLLLSSAALAGAAIGYLAALVGLWRNLRRGTRGALAPLVLLVVPYVAALVALRSVLGDASLSAGYSTPHHFLWLLPFLGISTALGLAQLPSKAIGTSAALLIVSNAVQTLGWYRAWTPDSRAAATYLERHWRRGDVLLLEAWSGVDIRAYERDRLATLLYVNYQQYPWARARVPLYSQAGVLQGQPVVASESLAVAPIGRDLVTAFRSSPAARIWSVTLDGPPDDPRVAYTHLYREALSTIGRQMSDTLLDGVSVAAYTIGLHE